MRGEVEQKRKAREDELDLDSHLSFPSIRRRPRPPLASSLPLSLFSSTPCPFLLYSAFAFLTFSTVLGERRRPPRRLARTLTRFTYRNKIVNNPPRRSGRYRR